VEIGIVASHDAIVAGRFGVGSAPHHLKVALAANGLGATAHTEGLGRDALGVVASSVPQFLYAHRNAGTLTA
jgi:hypothetical protein